MIWKPSLRGVFFASNKYRRSAVDEHISDLSIEQAYKVIYSTRPPQRDVEGFQKLRQRVVE